MLSNGLQCLESLGVLPDEIPIVEALGHHDVHHRAQDHRIRPGANLKMNICICGRLGPPGVNDDNLEATLSEGAKLSPLVGGRHPDVARGGRHEWIVSREQHDIRRGDVLKTCGPAPMQCPGQILPGLINGVRGIERPENQSLSTTQWRRREEGSRIPECRRRGRSLAGHESAMIPIAVPQSHPTPARLTTGFLSRPPPAARNVEADRRRELPGAAPAPSGK